MPKAASSRPPPTASAAASTARADALPVAVVRRDRRDDRRRDLVVLGDQRPPCGAPRHVAVAEAAQHAQRRPVVGLAAPLRHRRGQEAAAAISRAAAVAADAAVDAAGVLPAVRGVGIAAAGVAARPRRAVAAGTAPIAMRGAVPVGVRHRHAVVPLHRPGTADGLHHRFLVPGEAGGAQRHRAPVAEAPRVARRTRAALGLLPRRLADLGLGRRRQGLAGPAARRDELRRPQALARRRHRLKAPPDLAAFHPPVVRRSGVPVAGQRVVLPLAVVGPAEVDRQLPGAQDRIAGRVAAPVMGLRRLADQGPAGAVLAVRAGLLPGLPRHPARRSGAGRDRAPRPRAPRGPRGGGRRPPPPTGRRAASPRARPAPPCAVPFSSQCSTGRSPPP